MIALSLRFLAGRFHATPWGRHVNEGAVEWPPSPWRVLRAMVATWKRTLPDLAQESVEPVLRALSGPPEFVVPRASTGHARHYMPWFKKWFKKGPDDRTLVFDAFVAVPRDARTLVRWPAVELDADRRETLARILRNLNFLGRSESWCEASVAESEPDGGEIVCRPLEADAPPNHDIVRLLCADPLHAFSPDRVVSVATGTVGRGKEKRVVEERSTLCDPAWNLCMETLQLHEERWSDPPGSRWVPYGRPADCFQPVFRSRSRRKVRPDAQIARYALDSSVLPLVTETLPVAEATRRASMSIHGRLTEAEGVRGRSDLFSGKDARGQPLAGHSHAYYLPTDEDGDGRLDHLTVVSSAGFGSDERRALDRLREIRMGREGEDSRPLRALLLGLGRLDGWAVPPLGPACRWVSCTPYVAARHPKARGRARIDMTSPEARCVFLSADLGLQLSLVRPDLPIPVVDPVRDGNGTFRVSDRWRPIEFKRFRRKAGDDGGRRLAGAFRLAFPRPVRGPIAIGHSAHFGLGLFLPEK